VAVIPAHNEEVGIGATIISLLEQTRRPDEIIVVADNCTDGTAEIARAFGVTVFETAGNHHRKAGALNQALAFHLLRWADDTFVLVMDADSALVPEWVELAAPWVTRSGAVSGAYETRDARGLLALMQRVEYAHERQRIARKMGRVAVLSGAASMFHAHVLRQVAESRGSHLPGSAGDVYNVDSLTEDFEITLAIQRLGYHPRSPRTLRVVTDVMTTPAALAGQRLRWQRGYLETLRLYPLRQTWKAWTVQFWIYAASVLPLFMAGLVLTTWALVGIAYEPLWLLLVPVFAATDAHTARRAGRRGQILAAFVVPLYLYNVFRSAIYWHALYRALHGGSKTWT
jgi:poly-beta-1,6-N-acetyl-D-glucosamine synthase